MNPRIAELMSSLEVKSRRRCSFFEVRTTISNTRVEVIDAMVSIARISSSPRLILNAVGTVAQNRTASKA
jgi:hypothetical protein